MSQNFIKLKCRLSSDLIGAVKLGVGNLLTKNLSNINNSFCRRYNTTPKLTRKPCGIRNLSENSTEKAMRFIQFRRAGDSLIRLGLVSDNGVNYADLTAQTPYPPNMLDFLQSEPSLVELQHKLKSVKWDCVDDSIELLAPILNPEKIVCIGLNYADHCKEQNKQPPKEPMFFSKFASALVGPTGNVVKNSVSNCLDWEVELAVVIGKTAKNVPIERAMDYIFGYTVAQDISEREWQKVKNGGQFLIGKSMDTFCPLGPSIVHKSLIPDPHKLTIACSINGEPKQSSSTSQLIFKIDDIICRLSHSMTLKPGDVILTGTPSGVGMHRCPPEYLQHGDVIDSEIEQIGKLHNTVVDESATKCSKS